MTDTMISCSPSAPVYIRHCTTYDEAVLTEAVHDALTAIGVTPAMLQGKRIAVKPNLVMKKPCEAAATTHPAVLSALLSFLDACDCADVVIAESPGGPYTETALRTIYRVCGIEDAVKGHHARLNFDVSSVSVPAPDAHVSKNFETIRPIAEADVLFNVCKLKSHTLTRMSGAVKNTFGTIPGLTKFEFHARFPDYADFHAMLVDLSAMLHTRTLTVDICDAVIGMEGNGPTGGVPRSIGALLCSRNPFSLDMTAAAILGCAGDVPMIEDAAARGFCPNTAEAVPTCGDDWKSLILSNFAAPDSAARKRNALSWLPNLFGGSVYRWFQPRPVINKKTCIGCGECIRSCPVHTITFHTNKKGKKQAKIQSEHCIRCFCCQELCPYRSVNIQRNPILHMLAGLRR